MRCLLIRNVRQKEDKTKLVIYVAICVDDYIAAQGYTAREAKSNLALCLLAERHTRSLNTAKQQQIMNALRVKTPEDYRKIWRRPPDSSVTRFFLTRKYLRQWKVTSQPIPQG